MTIYCTKFIERHWQGTYQTGPLPARAGHLLALSTGGLFALLGWVVCACLEGAYSFGSRLFCPVSISPMPVQKTAQKAAATAQQALPLPFVASSSSSVESHPAVLLADYNQHQIASGQSACLTAAFLFALRPNPNSQDLLNQIFSPEQGIQHEILQKFLGNGAQHTEEEATRAAVTDFLRSTNQTMLPVSPVSRLFEKNHSLPDLNVDDLIKDQWKNVDTWIDNWLDYTISVDNTLEAESTNRLFFNRKSMETSLGTFLRDDGVSSLVLLVSNCGMAIRKNEESIELFDAHGSIGNIPEEIRPQNSDNKAFILRFSKEDPLLVENLLEVIDSLAPKIDDMELLKSAETPFQKSTHLEQWKNGNTALAIFYGTLQAAPSQACPETSVSNAHQHQIAEDLARLQATFLFALSKNQNSEELLNKIFSEEHGIQHPALKNSPLVFDGIGVEKVVTDFLSKKECLRPKFTITIVSKPPSKSISIGDWLQSTIKKKNSQRPFFSNLRVFDRRDLLDVLEGFILRTPMFSSMVLFMGKAKIALRKQREHVELFNSQGSFPSAAEHSSPSTAGNLNASLLLKFPRADITGLTEALQKTIHSLAPLTDPETLQDRESPITPHSTEYLSQFEFENMGFAFFYRYNSEDPMHLRKPSDTRALLSRRPPLSDLTPVERSHLMTLKTKSQTTPPLLSPTEWILAQQGHFPATAALEHTAPSDLA